MKFNTALTVVTFAAAALAASVPTTASIMKVIIKDFKKLSHLYSDVVAHLDAFPGNGMNGVNAIHNTEVTIEDHFSHVTNNVNILPQPIAEKNAIKIIDTYQAFTPTIIQSLNGMAAKAPALIALNAAPWLSFDVNKAANSCTPFASEIIAITPPAMLDNVKTMFDQLTAARNRASGVLSGIGV